MNRNILIMSLTRMGDLVQSTPLISGLRKKYPSARITLMVTGDFAGFVPWIPDIDDSVVLDLRQFTDMGGKKGVMWIGIYQYLREFMDRLKLRRFDQVVNLSHSRFSALMIRYLGIENVCGFTCNAIGNRRTEHPWMQYFGTEPFNRRLNPFNLVEIFTRSGDVKPEGKTIALLDCGRSAGENAHLSGVGDEEFLVGIQAGSSLQGRRWPPDSFARLADLLANRLNARLLLFGVAAEKKVANEIIRLMDRKDRVVDLIGKTDLNQLTALLKKCRYLVSNDTGTMHVAAALGTPVIGMFFAHAHPYETAPYYPGNLVFQSRIACAPCSYGVQCNNVVCVHSLRPQLVFSMIESHRQNGRWQLPENEGPWHDLNIYRTVFGKDNRLVLQPLIRHPLTLEDVFLAAYERLWLQMLDGGQEDGPGRCAVSETIRSDYDCGNILQILGQANEKIGVLQTLIALSEKGKGFAGEIIRSCQSKNAPDLHELGEKIENLDSRINLLGHTVPEVKPIADMFTKRKENQDGDDIENLASATKQCYEKLGLESSAMIEILHVLLKDFDFPACGKAQEDTPSISAAVPGK